MRRRPPPTYGGRGDPSRSGRRSCVRARRSGPCRGADRGAPEGVPWRRGWGEDREVIGLTRRKRLALLFLAIPIAIPLLFLLLDRLFPFPWQALDRPPAVVIADREGEPLRFLLPEDGRWRLPVRLAELPPELPRALVASEDQRFWRHPGVDPLAILRAAWSD